MPRYLRWIAAISSGIMAQFAFYMAFGAIAVGTGHKELGQSVGMLATLGSIFVTLLPTLAVNDWLAKRYPPIERVQSAQLNETPLDDRL